MFEFDNDIAKGVGDTSGSEAIQPPNSYPQPAMQLVDANPTPVPTINRHVRGFLYCSHSKRAALQVNNRVGFGTLVIMTPGGQVNPSRGDLVTLATSLRDEIGVSMDLAPSNTRFILSRTYVDNDQPVENVINFYAVQADGCVPRNMCPDSVLSVSWLSLEDIRRNLKLDNTNWRIQAGLMDALESVLDPKKNRVDDDGMREVARQDGGVARDQATSGSPAPLAY